LDRSDLELVLAVRLHGSLVKAARALRLTPPVVTKRLSALESHLGLRLFQRTTRRVSPTTEGHALCDRAAELLNHFVALEDEMREQQSEPSGPIRIACSFGFGRLWLGPLLAEFQIRYPAVRIDLQLCEQLPDLANEAWMPPFGSGILPPTSRQNGFHANSPPTNACWWPHRLILPRMARHKSRKTWPHTPVWWCEKTAAIPDKANALTIGG